MNAPANGYAMSHGLQLLKRLHAPGTLTIAFQPIVEVCGGGRRKLHGVECLTRGPRGTELEQASELFDRVRQYGVEVEVDRLCTAVALEAASELPAWLNLAVNVHASTLSRDRGFAQALALNARATGIDATRVTVEIVESSAPDDASRFAHALLELREMGFKLALDDIGLGHSNLKMFVDVEPHYFKIDRYFVHQVERNPYRLAVLACLADLGRRVGARVVAEGVESDASLTATLRSGIRLVQGVLLARPLSAEELAEHPLLLARATPAAPSLD
jgi:EAL domain-containing protein (putative c-di-GMP-specific phosphodiesterase class I)